MAYSLQNASFTDLLKLPKSEAVYEAILNRTNASTDALRDSLNGIAGLRKSSAMPVLLSLIDERDANGQADSLSGLGQLLLEQPAAELKKSRGKIESIATQSKDRRTRQLGFVAWMTGDGSGDAAFLKASQSKDSLRDLISAIPEIADAKLKASLYSAVRTLMFELPPNLKAEGGSAALLQSGIEVDFFHPNPPNVSIETLSKLKPKASGIVPEIVMDVPQLQQRDQFALRFSGLVHAPNPGSTRSRSPRMMVRESTSIRIFLSTTMDYMECPRKAGPSIYRQVPMKLSSPILITAAAMVSR